MAAPVDHRQAQRSGLDGVRAAYVGLPLLYAAFNTFPPLHDWIMRGLSLVSGGNGGSPLDPYDSVVIPFALGIAVWVWRRGPVAPGGLRSRLGMTTAALAAFATVATSEQSEVHGITDVETSSAVVIAITSEYGLSEGESYYESIDGGITWSFLAFDDPSRDKKIREIRPDLGWDARDERAWLETPRGKYKIEGPNIVLSDSSGESVAYSTEYLRESGNEWMQAKQTAHLGGRDLAFEPDTITYDPHSGNLIAAMGIQGVVVGTPDGQWTPVAVDQFAPIDSLSIARKVQYLMSSYNFWVAALVFPMSMLTLAFFLAHNRLRNPSSFFGFVGRLVSWVVMLFLVALSVVPLLTINTILDPVGSIMVGMLKFLMAVIVIGVGIGYLASTQNRLRVPWFWATFGSYIAMVAFVAVPLLAWLLLGISISFAILASIALCLITAFTLSHYLLRARSPAATSHSPEI